VKDSLTEISTDEYYEEKETSIFNLPYPELHLNEGKNTENYIPLKVFRTEVFRKNGCYVLIGGLTGLGWELLLLMAELGAGYISTFSRRPPSDEKQVEIEEVQKRFGCRILPMQVDITDIDGLKKTLLDLQLKLGEAQIKGVFHGGGVINDMLLNNMTLEDVEKPLQPKVLGTWNLHMATLDLPLDYFVLHSSIVAIFGNPGQCNYSAGNSFQDSFAHYRRSLGLCGQSINWSTLSLGMAAENTEMEKNFKSQGFYYLHKDDIRACFMRAVMTNPAQVTFGVFDWSIMEFHPTIKSYPFKFVGLLDKYGTKNATFKKTDSKYSFDIEEYNNANDEEKKEMIMDIIKKMAADTFIADDSALSAETRFVELGIDSMAAMSYANSVFDTMQVRIPVVTLLSDTTTIESLTLYLIENIQNGGGSSSTGGGDGQTETNREDNRKLLDYLRGTVTFMQRSLLNDYVKNPHSRNLSRQADYEVTGLKLKPKDWRVILNHLVKMNPELRRIYKINKEELTYESVLLPADEVEVEMQQVPFESICNGQETDDRDQVYFDLTKDLPIRFKIACKKNVTRMRMFIHSVISDLSGIAMLFRDIGSYMKPYICNESLPEKDTSIVPADAVRTALNPRMPDLKQYWKMQLSQDVHPFTFSDDIEEELDEANWYQFAEDVPLELVNDILNYTKSSGLSLYNFIVPVYMLFLYEKTNKDLIPLVTNNDMRGHVPQLKSFVTRCINAMPVIGDMRNLGKVSDYIKKSSTSLHRITQQSAFPYALIQDEMPTEELKKHIGRHRIVMDNMAHLNQTYKHNRVTIKVSNVHHTRYVYETTLYIMYDLQENKVALQYGYNTRAVKHEDAAIVPGRIMELMRAFLDHPDAEISDILSGNIVINSIPKSIKAPHMKISNEHNSVTDKKSPLKQRKPSKTSKRNNEITNSLGSDISILRQGKSGMYLG
jgi:NAD(P)-dependent dehydrogenase (short-subunit alcohol dehydrogenase family)/acyl carrier protein